MINSEYCAQRAREGIIAHMHDHNTKISKTNQAVKDFFEAESGVELEYEHMIHRKSFDFLIKNTNVLLEVNPSYTHSDIANHWGGKVTPDYHLMKTTVAEESGYRCIHLFDWDNLEKIATMLKPIERKLYARKCTIASIPNKLASIFIEENHIQGKVAGATKSYGLFNGDELVEVMTFGKPRYSRKYEWELLRLCTKQQTSVVGGASKLFKQFIAEMQPESIISYCDRAKFAGKVYMQIGMHLHHMSEPSKVWSKGKEHITDNLLRQRGFDQLFKTNYGKGTSNEQLMVEHGWLPVYDCGQAVYTWEVKL